MKIPMPPGAVYDKEALLAGVDLIGRTGARQFEVGYLHEGVPSEEAGWYAQARWSGTRLIAENHTDPVEAVEALAARVLTGGQCQHCRGVTSLTEERPDPRGRYMADGTVWTTKEQQAAPLCQWTRQGPRWVRGCERPASPTAAPEGR
ncbi:hypothetical protein ACLQ2R_03280 [Streptosporangium sp. DT93]|uniref:hypothetical protein n=1 Tax=Streptosporangium sp. DT93 TaxID=3393428 RepID=UPI003CF9AAB7